MKSSHRNVTLRDVAKASGLSLITVSRALRQPELVQPQTREKVMRTINEIGYLPNLTARSLVSQRSGMVGVVVPILASSLFADFAQGAASELRQHDRQMLLGVSNRSVDDEFEVIKTFMARQADAIIVTGFTHSDACRELLLRFDGPVVETWNLRPDAIDMCVGYDNFQASEAMTRYLLSRGYRRIAMVGGAFENNDQATDRRDGFLAAMTEAGASVAPEHVVSVPNPTTIASGRDALLQLMSSSTKPEAIFFQAEIPAHGAMMACLSHGYSVPDDVALAGFGDLSLSEHLPVPLTTVRLRAHDIGSRAASMVLADLDGQKSGEAAPSRHCDMGFEIIERQST
ncbi:LacI family DNA-binding transcriptional regulator [Granulosicoccus sp. 3-233]|uniref:LacI family DNA-binding transcriptional regulator n=1 Tax=Granulosicoccus sp. 3-233 TaxID=3417969 RepID=UPI003D32CE83